MFPGASRRCCPALLGLVAVASFGCGAEPTYPVHGKVIFKDGTPLRGGMVVFEPVDNNRVTARGDIRPDGTFVLGTRKPGDGAPAGKHRVLVSLPLAANAGQSKGPRPLHPRFERFESSKLERTVERRSNDFTIEVEKP